MTQLAMRLHIGATVVRAAMNRLVAGGEVNGFDMYRYGNARMLPLITEAQAALMCDDLVERGHFDTPLPDEYAPVMAIASRLAVDDRVIQQTIQSLQEERNEHGESPIYGTPYNNKNILTTYYSPAEQRLIEQRLINDGRVAPLASQGYWSVFTVRR